MDVVNVFEFLTSFQWLFISQNWLCNGKKSKLSIFVLCRKDGENRNHSLKCHKRSPEFPSAPCWSWCECIQSVLCRFHSAYFQDTPVLPFSLCHTPQSPLCQAQMAQTSCVYPFNVLPSFIPSSSCCLSPSWHLASAQVGSLPWSVMMGLHQCLHQCWRAAMGLDLCHVLFKEEWEKTNK